MQQTDIIPLKHKKDAKFQFSKYNVNLRTTDISFLFPNDFQLFPNNNIHLTIKKVMI